MRAPLHRGSGSQPCACWVQQGPCARGPNAIALLTMDIDFLAHLPFAFALAQSPQRVATKLRAMPVGVAPLLVAGVRLCVPLTWGEQQNPKGAGGGAEKYCIIPLLLYHSHHRKAHSASFGGGGGPPLIRGPKLTISSAVIKRPCAQHRESTLRGGQI